MLNPPQISSPQPRRLSLKGVLVTSATLALSASLATPASAATRYLVEGYLTPSATDGVAFSLSQDPLDPKTQDLTDPDSRVEGPIPRRVRIVTEFDPAAHRAATPINGISSSPGLYPGMKANPTQPALWAGTDNGLYPSLDEPISSDKFTSPGVGVVTEERDTDDDGTPDSEDTDDDGDNVPDLEDAFPLDPNESLDTDGDTIGNNADPDDDNDGTPDPEDAFPLDPTESLDTDGDTIGNNADPDDDGDLMPDIYETKYGLNPLKDDAKADLDLDGYSNYQEFRAGTSPKDPRSRFVFTVEPVSFKSKLLTFTWNGVKGKRYDFEASKDGKRFTPLEIKLTVEVTGKPITVQIKKALIPDYSFFRVRVY